MNSEKYLQRFREDAHEFISSIREILNSVVDPRREEAVSGNAVNELFRLFHSLKSEASQVGEEEISGVAHELESTLVPVRNGDVTLDQKIRDTLFNGIAEMEQVLGRRETERMRGHGENSEKDSFDRRHGGFSDFEKRILDEALKRGDRFYRITCSLNSNAEFQQPRAYLIISNLELISNVIKTVPPLTSSEENAYSTFDIYLTAGVNESDLFSAVNVDEVEHIRIEPLESSTGSVVASGPAEEDALDTRGLSGPYRVDPSTLEEAYSRLEELRSAIGHKESNKPLMDTANRIGELLRSISARSVGELFSHTKTVVATIAEQLEKKIEVVTEGDTVETDSRILDVLADPLFHIVRNAVDHGIESPDERAQLGKKRVGTIRLSARKEETQLVVSVEDDGYGVDRNSIIEQASAAGFEADESSDLLSILGRPGFTTIDNATGISGRGFGLDIVMQRVSGIGGSVALSSEPGNGTNVVIRVPVPREPGGMLVVRWKDQQLSIPRSHSSDIVPFSLQELRRDGQGRLLYNKKPVYSPEGRMVVSKRIPREGFLVLTRIHNKPAWLFVDEVLFERDGTLSTSDKIVPITIT